MKKLFVFAFAISLMAALAVSTSALEYTMTRRTIMTSADPLPLGPSTRQMAGL